MTARTAWKTDPMRVQLREMREARDLSLANAERASGIKAQSIGTYERGERVPPPHVLRALFRAYGHEVAVVPVGTVVPLAVVDTLRRLLAQLETGQVAA